MRSSTRHHRFSSVTCCQEQTAPLSLHRVGGDSYPLSLNEPKKYETGDPVLIRGDIYLWWVSRDPLGEIGHSYTPLPDVGIRVYDVYGRLIKKTVGGLAKDTTEQIDTTGVSVTHEFSFALAVDEPRPLALIFDVDASIETRTHSGVQIEDTFVPVVAWIAGLSTGIHTTLSVAVPTAGQLFAAGGIQAIRDQLELLGRVLEDNEQAVQLWKETSERVETTACNIASLTASPCS